MKYKRIIALMLVLITSIIISIQNVNASTEKIEIYFEVNGQRNFTKAYLDQQYFEDPYDGDVVRADIYAVSLTGSTERLTNIQFDFSSNSKLQGIIYVETLGTYVPFGGGRPETWFNSGTLNNSV